MKPIIAGILLISCSINAHAQQDSAVLNAEQTRQLLNKLPIDSGMLIRQSALYACNCIDSVRQLHKKGANDYTADITSCIDNQVSSLQISLAVLQSMKKGANKIEISNSKENPDYVSAYRNIERWLRDSCSSMNHLMFTSDKETQHSFSDNADAIAAYNKGAALLREEKYSEALPYFEEAVKHDPQFAFAWDNIGICNRRTGDYKKAVAAYKKSIAIDPEGITPLHNLPVAYEHLKKYDDAIDAYSNISKVDPKDPEAFFGKGRIYLLYKQDYERALDNLCKAYNLYSEARSPYRTDAEKLINMLYSQMKKDGKEEAFNKILKENNITPQ